MLTVLRVEMAMSIVSDWRRPEYLSLKENRRLDCFSGEKNSPLFAHCTE